MPVNSVSGPALTGVRDFGLSGEKRSQPAGAPRGEIEVDPAGSVRLLGDIGVDVPKLGIIIATIRR